MLHKDYILTRELDLPEGLTAISLGNLYDDEETISRVQPFFDSTRDPAGANPKTGEKVLAIWLVRRQGVRANPVGMAIVSQEHEVGPECHPHLNLFVTRAAAGLGLGKALIAAAQEAYPKLWGHYNKDTVALYERAGVHDVIQLDHDPSGQDPATTLRIAQRHATLHAQRWENGPNRDRPHHARPTFTTPDPSAPVPPTPQRPSQRP